MFSASFFNERKIPVFNGFVHFHFLTDFLSSCDGSVIYVGQL